MLTDRFIKLPIQLVDKSEEEMGIASPGTDAYSYLLATAVEEFYETTDKQDVPCIQIWTRTGRGFVTYMTLKDLIEKLNK